jgi:transposase
VVPAFGGGPVSHALSIQAGCLSEYDRRIEQIAKEVHPEVALLKQVKGVGTLIALTYVLTLDDPQRFRRSRDAGRRAVAADGGAM